MSEETEFDAPSAAELQMRFTQYRIEKLVAVGGMGAVYRAVQLSVDRPVAFKILSPKYAENEKFRERFGMEAKAMAKLNHPNIVQLYDYGESGDIIWMAQEWVPGQTVEDVLDKEGALDPMEAAAMVAQACEGLGYAHKQGIVHRDVKPANMMQDDGGNIKVMDFGLAHASYWAEPSLQSEEGARFATTEYAGPEIWDMEKEPDHRVDIFALGVLLYEALTGDRPMDPYRPPSEMNPELDPRYDEVVMRSMQTLPEDRYGSCAEFLGALREVVTTPRGPVKGQLLTGPVTGPVRGPLTVPVAVAAPQAVPVAVAVAQPGQVIPPPKKKSMTEAWVVMGVILVLIVVLVAVLTGGGDPKPEEPKGGGPSTAELAGNAGGKVTMHNGKPETGRERVARVAREQMEKLKKMEEEEAKKPKPKREEEKKGKQAPKGKDATKGK